MQKLRTYIFIIGKWLSLLAVTGVAVGSLSAMFLTALNWATDFREQHEWLIFFLPVVGLLIGLLYHYAGKTVERGNNQVFDTIHRPEATIPFKMAPLVLVSTILTHLFGGSAGREGTALQMSAAVADQLHPIFKLNMEERRILLISALGAGFASVFGTPLAGAVFGIEVLLLGRFPFKALVPALLIAYFAAYVTELWGVGHTTYRIAMIPSVSLESLLYSVLAGAVFGLAAVLFVCLTAQVSALGKKINYAPLRPVIGGVIIVALATLMSTQRYLGLGIPVIVQAFDQVAAPQEFMLKILFTAITLGLGFKGGEVTPLFFIGATCGSALSLFLPLPVGLLAGMGFVAVFGAAAKTPVACIAMAMELFGWTGCVYIAIACVVAYLISGKYSIYNAIDNKVPKHFLFNLDWVKNKVRA